MFGKKKCSTAPVFQELVQISSPQQERTALAALKCSSGADMTPVGVVAPSAAALVKAAKLPNAVWMYGQRLECTRCKQAGQVNIAAPDSTDAPNKFAVRSNSRPDFYALQHAFLPEWFLNQPQQAITILSTKLDGWQAATMKQIGGIVARTGGEPMPIKAVQIVRTPGETTSLLIDFMTPIAPVEAHYALLVGGATPRYLMSEKTHLGEDRPIPDMAGLTEWTFANAQHSEMTHTAIDLLPDTSRSTFLTAVVDLLKRRLA